MRYVVYYKHRNFTRWKAVAAFRYYGDGREYIVMLVNFPNNSLTASYQLRTLGAK